MPKITVDFGRSAAAGKKFTAVVRWPDGRRRTVHFGAAGMSDYTHHRDAARKQRYLARHAAREDWTKGGVGTAGFWSRWALWNLPTLGASLRDLSRRFGVLVRRV